MTDVISRQTLRAIMITIAVGSAGAAPFSTDTPYNEWLVFAAICTAFAINLITTAVGQRLSLQLAGSRREHAKCMSADRWAARYRGVSCTGNSGIREISLEQIGNAETQKRDENQPKANLRRLFGHRATGERSRDGSDRTQLHARYGVHAGSGVRVDPVVRLPMVGDVLLRRRVHSNPPGLTNAAKAL